MDKNAAYPVAIEAMNMIRKGQIQGVEKEDVQAVPQIFELAA